jgi:hypothetical protein
MLTKEELLSFSMELVQNNIDRAVKGFAQLGSDSYKKIKIKTGSAFSDYLDTAVRKYSEIKTILYRDAPVFLYNFYIDNDLQQGENIVNTSYIIYTADNIPDIQ